MRIVLSLMGVMVLVGSIGLGSAQAQRQTGNLYGTTTDVDAVATAEDCDRARRDGARDAEAICEEAEAYEAWQATSSGDYDGDGDVDGADFLTWQRGYGGGN